jgi:NitT/TauT family transport system ATP-binding protein
LIRFENVTKEYVNHGGSPALAVENANLRIAAEEFVCLAGPSGCGKSTLLNLAAGFIRPTSGRVLFDDSEVLEPGPERAVVFQDPTLFPWLNVRQNVEFGLSRIGLTRQQEQARAAECLRRVGLSAGDDLYPHALSGGMRQRVALARVLALDPKALLMDEPFGALDANSRERLQNELLRLWEAHRRTVLFVTHSVEEAAYLADRVVIMGPAPNSIRADISVALPRPRSRTSEAMRALLSDLRGELDALPCCLPPAKGKPDHAY